MNLRNITSNTRKSVSSGYPNTEKFVENRGEAKVFEQISRSVLKNEAVGRVFLTTSRCFETVVKNYFEFFI